MAGTVLGCQTCHLTGALPKAATGATARSRTFLQKVCEAGSNSCATALPWAAKSLQEQSTIVITAQDEIRLSRMSE